MWVCCSGLGVEQRRRFWSDAGYFIIRRKRLAVDDLYLRGGEYEYAGGFNWRAIGALIVGSGVALMGLVIPAVRFLYDYSWFVGFVVAFGAYWGLMSRMRQSKS